jgi:hypothetical protein
LAIRKRTVCRNLRDHRQQVGIETQPDIETAAPHTDIADMQPDGGARAWRII